MRPTSSEEPVTLIIDGTNMAYRAKYKFQLSNKGIDTSITYGFIKMLIPLIRDYNVNSVIVAWDGGIPTFRTKLVPEYKANRHIDEDPEERKDFKRQMVELHIHALPAMGVVSIYKDKVEADDIIYHAAKVSSGKVLIVSSDKDLLQCCSESVSVLNPSRDKVYTPELLEDEIGIPAKDYIHWRALQGDSSDNISGVFGIGEKTATKLFKEFGSLSGICNAADGCNPAGRLSDKLGDAVKLFGMNRINNNVMAMALFRDRCGCRLLMYNEIRNYQPLSKVRLMNYMMKNGFASFVDTLPGLASRLVKPALNIHERYPAICVERISI